MCVCYFGSLSMIDLFGHVTTRASNSNSKTNRYIDIFPYIYSEQGGIFYGPKLVNNERS